MLAASTKLSYRCTSRLHLSMNYLHVLAETPYSPVSILLQDTYTTRFVNIIAFVYYGRKYQFTVGPFGLNISNTASGYALESVLNVSLLDCEDKMNDLMMNVYIYIYDLLVSSSSFDEHLQRLRILFGKIDISGMTLKLTKCEFVKGFLGHIISSSGMSTDPKKLMSIRCYPQPSATY
ncbi:unnamed protein product [Macrosiphum euphorbiae]|uniref:Reverse transcriptase domain-containing protein n=1 Tax=Macrosiphum euphorbiae TaxID=13131 RepID=A0AAV0W9P2_9HEMI|nr:unnamed protein product [Macrosiphum euphorbiae]